MPCQTEISLLTKWNRVDDKSGEALSREVLVEVGHDPLHVVGPLGPVALHRPQLGPRAPELGPLRVVAALGVRHHDDVAEGVGVGVGVGVGGPADDDGGHGEGHGEDEPGVVVGVLADEVDAARGDCAERGGLAEGLEKT